MDFASLGLLLTLLHGGCLLAASVACADATVRGDLSARLAATLAYLFILPSAAFFGLAAVGQFNRPVGTAFWILAAGAAAVYFHRSEGTAERFADDLEALRESGRLLLDDVHVRIAALVGGGLAVAHAARGFVMPPLGWDALTYHLVRAALWVKHGGFPAASRADPPPWFDLGAFADYGAPEAWTYYRHLLPSGDGLAAWAMLGSHTDAFVPLPGLLAWGTIAFAAYALARTFGGNRRYSAVAALVAAWLPAIRAHATTAYVDNPVAALELLAAVLFVHMERSGRGASGVLAVAALACAASMKKTGLFFLVGGTLLFLGLVARETHRGRRLRRILEAGLAGGLLLGPPLLYLWWHTGSPTYPFGVQVGPFVLFEEAPAMARMRSGLADHPIGLYLFRLVFGGYGAWFRHVNLGPAFPLVAAASLLAAVRLYRRETWNWTLLAFGVTGFAAAGLFLARVSGSGLNVARYWSAFPVLCIALVPTLELEWRRPVLYGGLAVGLLYGLPVEWTRPDVLGVSMLVTSGALLLLLAWPLGAWLDPTGEGGWPRRAAWVTAALAVGLALLLPALRARYRLDIYRAAERQLTRSNIPVLAESLPPPSFVRKLDHPNDSFRVAVASGWDGKGHNWYVYPLFGRRLQNDLLYVPTTRDGSVLSTIRRPRRQHRMSADAWHARLKAHGVDYVAVLAPRCWELEVMERFPGRFELVERDPVADATRLYRVR